MIIDEWYCEENLNKLGYKKEIWLHNNGLLGNPVREYYSKKTNVFVSTIDVGDNEINDKK